MAHLGDEIESRYFGWVLIPAWGNAAQTKGTREVESASRWWGRVLWEGPREVSFVHLRSLTLDCPERCRPRRPMGAA